MKLVEKKTRVPATFLTSYISNAWDQVGIIKSDLDSIKKQFTDTKAIEECLTALSDAYLILAGRFQNYLDNKGEVEQPDPEALKEDINVYVNKVEVKKPSVQDDLLDIANAFDTIPEAEETVVQETIPPQFMQPQQNVVRPIPQPDPMMQHLQPYTPEPATPMYDQRNMYGNFGNMQPNQAVMPTPPAEDNIAFDEMPAPDFDSGDDYQAMMDMLKQKGVGKDLY